MSCCCLCSSLVVVVGGGEEMVPFVLTLFETKCLRLRRSFLSVAKPMPSRRCLRRSLMEPGVVIQILFMV